MNGSTVRRLSGIAVLLCAAPAAGADRGAELAEAKLAMAAIQPDVRPLEVNRLDGERRYAIWDSYYGLLEQLGRMQVHYEMMTRHGWNRRVEFDIASGAFARELATLQRLLPAGD